MSRPRTILAYTKRRRPAGAVSVPLLAGVGLAGVLNAVPYLLTRGAPATDCWEWAGLPFVFYRRGGVQGFTCWSQVALVADASLGLLLGGALSLLYARLGRDRARE